MPSAYPLDNKHARKFHKQIGKQNRLILDSRHVKLGEHKLSKEEEQRIIMALRKKMKIKNQISVIKDFNELSFRRSFQMTASIDFSNEVLDHAIIQCLRLFAQHGRKIRIQKLPSDTIPLNIEEIMKEPEKPTVK